MGYEIWDRDVQALFADFDDEAQALEYLRTIVRSLNAEQAAQQLERYRPKTMSIPLRTGAS